MDLQKKLNPASNEYVPAGSETLIFSVEFFFIYILKLVGIYINITNYDLLLNIRFHFFPIMPDE